MVGIVASIIVTTLLSALNPKVDLGYGVYSGYTDRSNGLNIFKGIRYAAPPIGNLRFAKPQAPSTDNYAIYDATEYAAQCPQSPNSDDDTVSTQDRPDADESSSEDCLFLNVWAPSNATDLPVLVWIHGGGYGEGSAGGEDPTDLIVTNNHGFIVVAIQYRLGAFGFLSSDEVARNGTVNAGLYDMLFALEWVQNHIHQFGGDPAQVTISGISAGAGAAMLLGMAYNGTLGTKLFNQSITASPYLPMQHGYRDWIPSQTYYAFAYQAGCLPTASYTGPTILQCLRGKDTKTLLHASQNVSASGVFGTWAFLPVTDEILIQDLPSRQLSQRRVNGRRMLTGNSALEGATFVPTDISTEDKLVEWMTHVFPLFTESDISEVLQHYPNTNASDNAKSRLYSTNGISGATAVNQSALATGHQQRAFDIYGEATFVCPSYWLAEGYSDSGRQSFKYQYSIPLGLHASDVSGYFGPPDVTQGPDFEKAFMTIWGNFIMHGNPSTPIDVANGASKSNASAEAVDVWPVYTLQKPMMVNLNQTGGKEESIVVTKNANATVLVGPGLENDFTLVNAYTWEGGRGKRCDFWKSLGQKVPE